MPNLPRHALYKATEYLIQWIENKNSSNRFSDDRKCQIIKQIDLDIKNNIEFVLALYDISIIRTTRKKIHMPNTNNFPCETTSKPIQN